MQSASENLEGILSKSIGLLKSKIGSSIKSLYENKFNTTVISLLFSAFLLQTATATPSNYKNKISPNDAQHYLLNHESEERNQFLRSTYAWTFRKK